VNSLLSAISGKFSATLVLGTLFPVTVFVFLLRILWMPLLPVAIAPVLLASLSGLDEKLSLLALTIVAIVLSGLLYYLNIPMVRLYEGYPWQETWLGRRLVTRHKAEFQALQAKNAGLFPLQAELEAEIAKWHSAWADADKASQLTRWIEAAGSEEETARRDIFALFPKESSILPTRLGNVIRSFENYPERQYSMAGITLWPRLISVIPADYAETIDSAKAAVDFMLNSATLSGLLALLVWVTGLFNPTPFASGCAFAVWSGEVAVLALCSWWFYVQAIAASSEWGDLKRAAFDLFRGNLLEKLGYLEKPKTAAEERVLWRAISSRLIVGDPPPGAGDIPPYATSAAAATFAACTPSAALQLTRGVIREPGSLGTQVVIEVRYNGANPSAPPVRDAVICDTVPAEFDYQWGSARASVGEVEVEGINPYRFRLTERIRPGSRLRLSYQIVPRIRSLSMGDLHEPSDA
jgi:hypothetical protein